MRKRLLSLLFSLLCLSVHGASLEFAFQLGEKQQPRLDKLLPDVTSRITFNKDGTKLIAHEMGGTIVEWDLQKRQKRVICDIEPDQWAAYTLRLNYLLTPKADNGVSVVDVADGNEIQLVKYRYEIKGQYENGYFSPDSQLVALTKGDNDVELWRFSPVGIPTGTKPLTLKQGIETIKIHNFKTQLPVRNGIVISSENRFVAVAEGTYRDGEGHRTIIEIWDANGGKQPLRIFNTGEILGVWNVIFTDYGRIFATDTQLNGKSGIRVWEIGSGRQLFNKSGFEAYWVRALTFIPNKQNLSANEMQENLRTKGYLRVYYLVSGDEKGNLRVWAIPYNLSKSLETKSVIWENYPTGIQALAFSPNGEYLAVALWDTTIQILRWKRDEQSK